MKHSCDADCLICINDLKIEQYVYAVWEVGNGFLYDDYQETDYEENGKIALYGSKKEAQEMAEQVDGLIKGKYRVIKFGLIRATKLKKEVE